MRHGRVNAETTRDNISIHAPIVGCDQCKATKQHIQTIFQSTHPSWGATKNDSNMNYLSTNFNPRTHRGVRQAIERSLRHLDKFQSTHPSWGATRYDITLKVEYKISIHAPIVGCDDKRPQKTVCS